MLHPHKIIRMGLPLLWRQGKYTRLALNILDTPGGRPFLNACVAYYLTNNKVDYSKYVIDTSDINIEDYKYV